MAVIKLGSSKNANNSLIYCDKKAELKSGIDCDINDLNLVMDQFKATRSIWNKNDGLQCHIVIQSFKPNEIEIKEANRLGEELAKKIAFGHEIAIFTHNDTNHIHNHIVINSVNYEDGIKYHSNKKKLYEIRGFNDEICLRNGLSIPTDSISPKVSYTLAEREILNKGGISWKDEIRCAIDESKLIAKDYNDFKSRLVTKYGIEINDSRKHIIFMHPDYKDNSRDSKELDEKDNSKNNKKRVRGKTLGLDYTKEMIIDGINKRVIEDSRSKSNKLREYSIEISSSRIERGDSNINQKLNSINKSIDSIGKSVRRSTSSGREEAEQIDREKRESLELIKKLDEESRAKLDREQQERDRSINDNQREINRKPKQKGYGLSR